MTGKPIWYNFYKKSHPNNSLKLHTSISKRSLYQVKFVINFWFERKSETNELLIVNFVFSFVGKCQCLVQLSTLPVAVCYGTGVTSKDAQASAAQNALEYLKIMTKK